MALTGGRPDGAQCDAARIAIRTLVHRGGRRQEATGTPNPILTPSGSRPGGSSSAALLAAPKAANVAPLGSRFERPSCDRGAVRIATWRLEQRCLVGCAQSSGPCRMNLSRSLTPPEDHCARGISLPRRPSAAQSGTRVEAGGIQAGSKTRTRISAAGLGLHANCYRGRKLRWGTPQPSYRSASLRT